MWLRTGREYERRWWRWLWHSYQLVVRKPDVCPAAARAILLVIRTTASTDTAIWSISTEATWLLVVVVVVIKPVDLRMVMML